MGSIENFGEVFIGYVKVLFNDMFNCVMNNGWKSKNYPITRSVKQGCSTAPFLFIISLELLAIKVRNNEKIKGITIDQMEHKISQFANDITLYL